MASTQDSTTEESENLLAIIKSLQSKQGELECRVRELEDAEKHASNSGTSGDKEPSIDPEDELIGAIDQGTTSSRFLVFNKKGHVLASHQIVFSQIYPHAGWHEHDPHELVVSVTSCIDAVAAQLQRAGVDPRRSVRCVGITNQRETTVLWHADTGEPLCNAVVWTDTRAGALARELKAREGADGLQRLCGLPLSTYPSCSKLLWLLDNVAEVKAAYDNGKLAFGTVDAWLVYKLNGGPERNVHVTDATNASRSMFMNLHTLKYDDELLDFFKLDRKKLQLPKIVKSSDPDAFGSIASGLLSGVPIMGVLGDQSAALVGQKGFSPGKAKNTYGTGCFLLYNVGEKPVISHHGLLATVAYDFGDKPVYALEGSIAVAGSALKFLTNNLGLAESSPELNDLAASVDDNGGVIFVTAFSGLFAPYWVDNVKGTILGITQYTSKGHLARAALEATCYQTKAILDAMEKDSGARLQRLAVDGGMSNSDLCMQTQADLIGMPVDRPQMRETTALGAAIAAGLAAGIWHDLDELADINTAGATVFEPEMAKQQSSDMFAQWQKAVDAAAAFI